MVEIKDTLAYKGSNCRPCYVMTPKYITIHNTANTSKGAGATAHASYLRNGGKNAYTSYHFAVDDKLIVRIIPETEVAWHAGDGTNGTGNRKSIGIEICENPESNLTVATDNAAMLCAVLMQKYGIGLANVVQHNHWTGKNCPNRIRKGQPYNWATFLAKVNGFYNALVNEEKTADGTIYHVQTGAFAKKENAENYAAELNANGVAAFVKEN